ncbi:MAG: hypothetical protein ACFE9D_05720 [Promethearchaeota archaeon]
MADTPYIEEIIINKNGVFAMNHTYTSQASTSSMTDTFNIYAEDDDILQVIAICSISGQIRRQITVSSVADYKPNHHLLFWAFR